MLEASEKSQFYAQGLRFSCKRCSACCRFDAGYVFLSMKDTSSLCAALNMQHVEFLDTYCRWVPGENGKNQLSLREKQNYDCVFLEFQSWWRLFGLWNKTPPVPDFSFLAIGYEKQNNWKMAALNCPGMDQGTFHSEDSMPLGDKMQGLFIK